MSLLYKLYKLDVAGGLASFVWGQKGYVRISSTMFDQLLTRSVDFYMGLSENVVYPIVPNG